MSVTIKQLDNKLKELNDLHNRKGGVTEPGAFYLDKNHLGYQLVQVVNESGGVHSVVPGRYSKKDVYGLLVGILNSYEVI